MVKFVKKSLLPLVTYIAGTGLEEQMSLSQKRSILLNNLLSQTDGLVFILFGLVNWFAWDWWTIPLWSFLMGISKMSVLFFAKNKHILTAKVFSIYGVSLLGGPILFAGVNASSYMNLVDIYFITMIVYSTLSFDWDVYLERELSIGACLLSILWIIIFPYLDLAVDLGAPSFMLEQTIIPKLFPFFGVIVNFVGYVLVQYAHLETSNQLEQALDDLHKSQAYQNAIFHNIDAIVLATDEEGNITAINQSISRLGHKASDFIGQPYKALLMLDAEYQDAGKSPLHAWASPMRGTLKRKGGGTGMPVRVRSSYIPSHNCFAIVVTDISELVGYQEEIISQNEELAASHEELATINNQLQIEINKTNDAMRKLEKHQSMLIKTEKLTALGQLTAGVSHEINNPVNYISGGLAVLKSSDETLRAFIAYYDYLMHKETELPKELRRVSEDFEELWDIEDRKEIIAIMEDGIKRVKMITKGLALFAQADDENFKQVEIHSLIDEVLLMLRSKYLGRVEVVCNYCCGGHLMIDALEGGLVHVLMHTIGNAIESIPNKGEVSIQTMLERNSITIYIRDTGVGMDEDELKQAFNPFFTTKPIGEGTGLGLSMSQGIISSHNGSINIASQKGKGSCVEIHLPLTQE